MNRQASQLNLSNTKNMVDENLNISVDHFESHKLSLPQIVSARGVQDDYVLKNSYIFRNNKDPLKSKTNINVNQSMSTLGGPRDNSNGRLIYNNNLKSGSS